MPKKTLTPKVALITGAARRIGKEIACLLHDTGANIILHYHTSKKDATQLCDALNQKRPRSAVMLSADLKKVEAIKALVQKALEPWKRLDVLINNASQFYRTPLNQATETAWDDLISSNLKAPFFLAQAAAPFLNLNKGCIVNITDIHTDFPLRDYSIYCISKAGLSAMTKILAKELGPLIRVNAIAPGAILWPEGENALPDAEKQKIIAHTTLLRPGSPEDIAKAVLFFVQDAGYVTGQTLHIDGGRTVE